MASSHWASVRGADKYLKGQPNSLPPHVLPDHATQGKPVKLMSANK